MVYSYPSSGAGARCRQRMVLHRHPSAPTEASVRCTSTNASCSTLASRGAACLHGGLLLARPEILYPGSHRVVRDAHVAESSRRRYAPCRHRRRRSVPAHRPVGVARPESSIAPPTGAPGPDYWQQRADYTIAATLDTDGADGSRHGEHSLHEQFARHAALRLAPARPEPVSPGEQGRVAVPAALARRGVRGFRGGYEITGLQVNGRGAAAVSTIR